MRDPYEVLGVDRKANEAEIKSAFRRQAKKLHPDANKNDPKAASRFAELNAAYEILGEEDKRKAFDRGEIDAEGKPRFHGYEGFGGGLAAAPAPAGSKTFSGKPLAVRPVAGVMAAGLATPSRRRISASERTSGRR